MATKAALTRAERGPRDRRYRPARHTQHAVFSQISVSNLLWSVFTQPAPGLSLFYEIITTNLVRSHDWVHGIFLCLNGGSGPCQGNSDTVSRQNRGWFGPRDGPRSLKGNIHLKHDEFQKQHVGALKRSWRGSRKVVGDLCTVEMLCQLKIANVFDASFKLSFEIILFTYPHISCHLAFEHKDRRAQPE